MGNEDPPRLARTTQLGIPGPMTAAKQFAKEFSPCR